ncbi:MAG: hypothetical protein WCA30_01015 [Dermatophilaceae bacterium]
MSHSRLAGTVVVCLTVLALGSAPAGADPPITFTADDFFATIADGTNDLVAFVNTTREDFCTDEMVAAETAFREWVLGGEVGDPPEFPAVLGLAPIAITEKNVGSGNIRGSFEGTVPIELWTFEEGKSPSLENLWSPCIDTDGLVDGTDEAITAGEFFAAGTATWSAKDNDLEGSGPRTNIWGERIAATVSGPTGDYSYTVVFKNQGRDFEYLKGSATFALKPR